ncbi:MAG: cyclic nucleotide-binding domain-containing protein [Candidatus Binatia bacterium]
MRRMSKDRKLRKLAAQPLFAGCSRLELMDVGRVADQVREREGSLLIRRGRLVREFVIVAEGTAQVLVDGRPVASVGPGAWLGDRELIAGRPAVFDVVASGEMTLFVVPQRAFSALVRRHPTVATRLLAALARRVPESDRAATFHPAALPTNARTFAPAALGA